MELGLSCQLLSPPQSLAEVRSAVKQTAALLRGLVLLLGHSRKPRVLCLTESLVCRLPEHQLLGISQQVMFSAVTPDSANACKPRTSL
jgi:hypothetical protein